MTNPSKDEGLMASAGQDGLIKYWKLEKFVSIKIKI